MNMNKLITICIPLLILATISLNPIVGGIERVGVVGCLSGAILSGSRSLIMQLLDLVMHIPCYLSGILALPTAYSTIYNCVVSISIAIIFGGISGYRIATDATSPFDAGLHSGLYSMIGYCICVSPCILCYAPWDMLLVPVCLICHGILGFLETFMVSAIVHSI